MQSNKDRVSSPCLEEGPAVEMFSPAGVHIELVLAGGVEDRREVGPKLESRRQEYRVELARVIQAEDGVAFHFFQVFKSPYLKVSEESECQSGRYPYELLQDERTDEIPLFHFGECCAYYAIN